MTTTTARIVFARNGRLEPFPASSIKALLLASPHEAVYTTMRCSAEHRIFDLPTHITRIHHGLTRSSHTKTKTRTNTTLSLEEVTSQVKTNLQLVAHQLPGASRLTLVALASMGGRSQSQFQCCGEPLPLPPASGATVVARRFVRANPQVKSTAFVQQREALLSSQGDCEETLLVMSGNKDGAGGGGEVMEGCSSNVFALVKVKEEKEEGGRVRHVLYTAKDGVLLGTMRKLALEMARELASVKDVDEMEVEVVEDAPKLSDVQQWRGCFITSTSRLLLPVATLLLPKDGVENSVMATQEDTESFDVIRFRPNEWMEKLQAMVEAGVLARSSKI